MPLPELRAYRSGEQLLARKCTRFHKPNQDEQD